MSNNFLEYMRFKNREQEKINEQKKVTQLKNKGYTSFHITDLNFRDAYAKVHADPRVYNNGMYLDPNKKYK